MERVTWEWILTGLDEALDFCRGQGLGRPVDGSDSRFVEHRARLVHLVEALKNGGQDGAREAFHKDPLRAFTALTEVAELVEILPFARTVPEETIRRKLRVVVKGPVLPTEENRNTNEARNVLFELNLASKPFYAGFSPELGEHPDILCRVDGRSIYIQCKRPLAEKGIHRAYTGALAQLAHDLRRAPAGARGVVVLSVTRLLNTGDLVFMHPTEGAGVEALGDWLGQTAARLCLTWREPSPATIGIVWHVLTPGYVGRERLLVAAEQLNLQPTRPSDSEDDRLFHRVFAKVQAN